MEIASTFAVNAPRFRTGRFVYRTLNTVLTRIFGRYGGVAVLEYAAALSPTLRRLYCASREPLVRAECDHFLIAEQIQIQDYEKVVMIGGGALPVTAIHWAGRFEGPIVVLEKNRLTTLLCKKLIRKLGLGNVQVVCQDGAAYEEYDNSIVLFSLHVTNKPLVVSRVLGCGDNKQAICVRVTGEERFDNDLVKWRTIMEYENFKVLSAMRDPG